MEFDELLAQVIALLQRQGRVSYGALKRRFKLDDDYLEDLKVELIEAQGLAADEQGRILIWLGSPAAAPLPTAPSVSDAVQAPLAYTPPYLTEKILASRPALEGERKQVTVLFADTKGSMELIQGLDPEDARRLLDPAIHQMMDAVHRYEGTVNQVLGDGIMALFGAPLAHEDHALRACYAALAMQAAMRDYTEEMRRTHGLEVRIRVGLNSGEVVVRTIGNDLHMDYSAVGQTTHLAARMEQLAAPGSILLTAATLRLVEGLVRVNALGPVPVKGLADAVEVFELVGASAVRRRLQAAVARGLTRFVGRETELAALQQALERAGAGHGQVVAVVGEAGVGKSRLAYECVHSHRTQGWRVLESASVSYGKATPYFPVIDLLKRYAHVEEQDDPRTIRAKVTGQIMTLDEALQDAIPALLSLLEALPADSPFLTLDPPQRRQRTLTALKRVLLRESQVQPLLLVCEDLHWIDAETQALLDSLIESLPTAQILLLVNYRPEYQHSWGSKTYYTQLRLDPLPPASAGAFLQTLLGDDPSLEALKRLLIARTEGNPFFLEESVRTLVETGVLIGERGAYRLAQPVESLQVPATVQAVLAARIDRLPPEEKQPPADRRGRRHGRALAAAAGHRRAARGGAASQSRAPAGGRVPVRDTALSRPRVHLQARPDPRGGLRQPPAGAAAGAPCPHCRGPGGASPGTGWPSRWNAWPTMPCGGRCGTRPWRTAGRRGRRPWRGRPTARPWGTSSRRSAPSRICQSSATRASRPSISGSPCARRSNRLAILGVSWRVCARPRPSRRPSTTRVGWDRSLLFLSIHFYLMGAYDQTIAAAQRALALATASGDVVLQALANHYLGGAYQAQGDYRRAIDCLGQTVASFEGSRRRERFGQVFLPAVLSHAWLAAGNVSNMLFPYLDSTLAILSRQEGEVYLTIDELCQSSCSRRRTSHATPARSHHTGLVPFCTTVFAPGLAPRPAVAPGRDPRPRGAHRHRRLAGDGSGHGAPLHQ